MLVSAAPPHKETHGQCAWVQVLVFLPLPLFKQTFLCWDNWKEETGKDKKPLKHKGAAVGDLEKARRDPSAYGVTGQAAEGGVRPPRPVRNVTPLEALTSPLLGQSTAVVATPVTYAHEKPNATAANPVGAVTPVAADLAPIDAAVDPPRGGDDEQTGVLKQISQLEAELEKAKAQQAEAKQKKAEAKQKKAASGDAADSAKPTRKRPAEVIR